MSARWRLQLENETATLALGACLATAIQPGLFVALHGDLGAGKTTLVRGFLRALGYEGPVRSPTFTLVEPYALDRFPVFHFDLYRLGDAEELEFIGAREYFDAAAVCLVEWPERARGWLPAADIEVELSVQGMGRTACITGLSAAGAAVVARAQRQ